MEHWQATGRAEILHFVYQRIEQFKTRGEEFAMQNKDAPVMDKSWEEFQEYVLKTTPRENFERILHRNKGILENLLKGIPTEELLQNIPTEELLHHLSPEEIVCALDEKEREQLRRLLDQPPSANAPGENTEGDPDDG
jgi:hypothetical protein